MMGSCTEEHDRLGFGASFGRRQATQQSINISSLSSLQDAWLIVCQEASLTNINITSAILSFLNGVLQNILRHMNTNTKIYTCTMSYIQVHICMRTYTHTCIHT